MKLSEELIEGLANIRRVVQEIVTTVEGRWALRFFLIPHKAPETAFVFLYHEQVVNVLPIEGVKKQLTEVIERKVR